MTLGRLYHTVRHLRPIQIYGRAWQRFYHPSPSLGPPPPLRERKAAWTPGPPRPAKLLGPRDFEFLNERRQLTWPGGWTDPAIHRLWLFNLHYFEDLISDQPTDREAWRQSLIAEWIRDNGREFSGPAWIPYVVSVRVVNWIKWTLAGGALTSEAIASLAVQARYIEKRLETHLLGNHLLTNAKALVFAGLFFSGQESERWLAAGLRILARQLPEQILSDGAHYELSPMYHSLVLEDLLDLINLARVYPESIPARFRGQPDAWQRLVERMQPWLAAMTLPDGQITLFNDAAWGIAPTPAELFAYATRLGIAAPSELGPGITHLAASGFVRVACGPVVAILDVGEIGPSFLPGHGHADVLSFELALDGQRLLVNSGTSVYYGNDAERHRQRGTAAHNTVVVDSQDSSEIWDNFRVARRAHPRGLSLGESRDGVYSVACEHTGYERLPGRPVHRREWEFRESALCIRDRLTGSVDSAEARFHLSPDVVAEQGGAAKIALRTASGSSASFLSDSEQVRLVETTYHPEFGRSIPNHAIVARVGSLTTHGFRW